MAVSSLAAQTTPRALNRAEPQHVDALLRLADYEQSQRRFAGAIGLYRVALGLEPGNLHAAARLARALFCAERWDEAWPAYHAARFRLMPDPPRVTGRDAEGRPRDLPCWTGGPAPRRLLVLCEQGLGDTIQFVRFLPALAERGVEITLAAPARLHALLRSLPCSMTLLEAASGAVRAVDGWTNLLDIPHALRIPPALYTATASYLHPDPRRVADWRARLGEGRLIGIQWRGNPAAPGDAARSAALADFASLAEAPGVRLVCLQKDASSREVENCSFSDRIVRLGPEFDAGPDAFLDAAAVLFLLERTVTVDTAMVHLAGALGRPADLVLAPEPDWRWLDRQEENVWYPSVRLRRRQVGEPWSAAVARAAADLGAPGGARLSSRGPTPMAPTSVGDLVDRLSILAIKAERLTSPAKRANVAAERAALEAARASLALNEADFAPLVEALRQVNATLWDVEDALRACEARGDFGPEFVRLARMVYVTNDRRAALKREINLRAGSALVEEKSYG